MYKHLCVACGRYTEDRVIALGQTPEQKFTICLNGEEVDIKVEGVQICICFECVGLLGEIVKETL